MVPVHAATYIHNLHMIRDIVFGFFKYHKFSHNEMITLFHTNGNIGRNNLDNF
jgi:hypothetical protein